MHGLGFVLESNLLTQNYLDSGKLVRAFADELSIPISDSSFGVSANASIYS